MKKQLPSFLAGMLTMALIGTAAIPALASAGMTITVTPVNVQVNGQTFQPKDVNGNDVPVFAYSGTTYAPLRALAEAYGLEVGYDSKANMATVASDSSVKSPNAATSNTPLNPGSFQTPSYVAETYTLYVNAVVAYEIDQLIVTSCDARYDLGMIMSKAGKYSNMGTNHYLSTMLFTEFPQYKDEIISEINSGYIGCVSYNNSVYIDAVNAIQFFRGNGIELYDYFKQFKDS